jgi:glycosyltransferase involved in cell wall biosynthesis
LRFTNEKIYNVSTLKLNILFILPEFYPTTGGGICTYYQELLSETTKNGLYNITVIQGSGVDVRGGSASWKDIPIYYLTADVFHRYRKRFSSISPDPELQNHMASSWAMFELAESLQQKFDAVVTTDWGFGFVPWIIRQQIPVIVHLHGSVGQINFFDTPCGWEFWSAMYLQTEVALLSFANQLVTHSHQNIKFWRQRFFIDKEITLVPATIAQKKILEEDTQSGGEKCIGMVVGRIQNWKGAIQLCEAVQLLPADKQNKLKIYWIGRDTVYSKTHSSTNNYLLKKYPGIWGKIIEPLGEKNKDELETLYQQSGWTLVPSTWDMFNLTAVEHLLHKKTLLCSKAAGVSDFLTNETAILFNSTPCDLANALEEVMNLNNSRLQSLGENGYKLAMREFFAESNCKKHLDVINIAINDFRPLDNMAAKFQWQTPVNKVVDYKDPREVLLNKWPLRVMPKLLVKRIKEKVHK